MQLLAVALALVPSLVSAAVFNVTLSNSLTYSPSTVTAAVGDSVVFTVQGNHSVTQAAFATPCTNLAGGINSGFPADGLTNTFTITINDTSPIYLYCAQTTPLIHCNVGMVGAINAPSTGNTFSAYQAASMAATPAGANSPSTSCAPTTNTGGYSYGVSCNSASQISAGAGLFVVAFATIAQMAL